MEKNRAVIETDIATLVFYMQGAVSYEDAWLLTQRQRGQMAKVVERHYEAMNPNKQNML